MKTILKIISITLLLSIPLLLIPNKSYSLDSEGEESISIDSDALSSPSYAVINLTYCIGCGQCVDILPECLELGQDNKVHWKVTHLETKYLSAFIECIDICPAGALYTK